MSTEPTRPRLLSIGAMSSRLGVRPQELRAEVEAGTIPHVRVGDRGLLFDPDAVLSVLEARAKLAANAGQATEGDGK